MHRKKKDAEKNSPWALDNEIAEILNVKVFTLKAFLPSKCAPFCSSTLVKKKYCASEKYSGKTSLHGRSITKLQPGTRGNLEAWEPNKTARQEKRHRSDL